jgi:hypothetical protein
MAMHNIPARVHKTVVKLKVKVEILESSSKKDNYRYYKVHKSIFGHSPSTFKILGKSKIGYKYKQVQGIKIQRNLTADK